MKNYAIPVLALATIALMGSCKSKESAYRQAFEKAKAQQTATTDDQSTVVAVNPVESQGQERQADFISIVAWRQSHQWRKTQDLQRRRG